MESGLTDMSISFKHDLRFYHDTVDMLVILKNHKINLRCFSRYEILPQPSISAIIGTEFTMNL